MLDSISLRHYILDHGGLSTMERIVKSGLISYNSNDFKKCELCVKSKLIIKPFNNIERNTNLLDFVHSDIFRLNIMLTRGGNRYLLYLLMIILDILMYIY